MNTRVESVPATALINVASVVVFVGFAGYIARFLEWAIPGGKDGGKADAQADATSPG